LKAAELEAATASLSSRGLRALRRAGPRGFARLLLLNARLVISGRYREHGHAYDRSFDQRYGVQTAGTVAVEELDATAELKERANRYEAAEPGFFNFLVDRLGLACPSDHLFIDVGSGMGRVMLMAALAGFRRVIGLELDASLTAIARRNVGIFAGQHPGTEFTLVDGDATQFAFPPVPTVLFMNNPFDAPLIARLMDGIERAHEGSGADLAILYMHSNHRELILARDGWEELDRGVFRNKRQFYSILVRRGRTPQG
jgi:16S rRNA G966 N2-methylase RsmD